MAVKIRAGLVVLGGGYFVPVEEVALIAPIEEAGDVDGAVDATLHRKPKTAIFTRSGRAIVSYLNPDVVAGRYEKARLSLVARAEDEAGEKE